MPRATPAPDALWRWLQQGWQDVWRVPGLTLSFGLPIAVLSMVVAALAWKLGRFALPATLLSGFIFVAPLIGVGLGCVSRDLAAGRRRALDRCLSLARLCVLARLPRDAGRLELARARLTVNAR